MAPKALTPLHYLLLSLLLIAALHLLLPLAQPIPMPWRLLGSVPLLLGIVLNLLADAALAKHHTTVKPFEPSAALVTDGVYRISRHPMYLGMALLLAGIALLLGSFSPLIVVALFVIAMERRYICVEEAMLAQRFGDHWQRYRQRTRRWL